MREGERGDGAKGKTEGEGSRKGDLALRAIWGWILTAHSSGTVRARTSILYASRTKVCICSID